MESFYVIFFASLTSRCQPLVRVTVIGLYTNPGRPRTEPEPVASGNSRELFTANRCELEPEWIFVNQNRHELDPDLFLDP